MLLAGIRKKKKGDNLLNREYLQVFTSPQTGKGGVGHREQRGEEWWCMLVAQLGEKCPCSSKREWVSTHSAQAQEVVREIHKNNNRSFNEFPYVDFISNKNITVSQFASLHFQKHLTGTCLIDVLVLGNPLSFCICLYIGKDKIILSNFKTST